MASDFAKRAKQHAENLRPLTLEVPELGEAPGKPLIIYSRTLTASSAAKFYSIGRTSNYEMYVEAILERATDEEGKRLFDNSDRNLLFAATFELIEKMGEFLLRKRTAAQLLEVATESKSLEKQAPSPEGAQHV